MTKYVIEKPYVYVVLQHANPIYNYEETHIAEIEDCILHGVYTDEFMAEGKAAKIQKGLSTCYYVSILKKPINGMIKKSTYDSEEDGGCWDNCKYLEY